MLNCLMIYNIPKNGKPWNQYTFFKEENDPLFYRGEIKGREETREEIISNLLEKLGLFDEQAASVANVPVEVVQKIRKKLKK